MITPVMEPQTRNWNLLQMESMGIIRSPTPYIMATTQSNKERQTFQNYDIENDILVTCGLKEQHNIHCRKQGSAYNDKNSIRKNLCGDISPGQDFQNQNRCLKVEFAGLKPEIIISNPTPVYVISTATLGQISLFENFRSEHMLHTTRN